MMAKKILIVAMIAVTVLACTGCIARVNENTERPPSGFFRGVWHGWIAPFTLILQFVDRDNRMYDPHNTGFAYEIGFYMAVISGIGGLSLIRKKKN